MAGISRDLQAGLDTLYRIQEVIGGSDEVSAEKKAIDAFKGDEFMELKYHMMKKLGTISENVKEFDSMDAGASAPQVKIRKQQEIREAFKSLSQSWQQLDRLYQKEASKKKSKFSQAELVNRQEIKENLKDHIDGLKEEFLNAYSGSTGAGGGGGAAKIQTFEAFKSSMAKKTEKAGGAGAAEVKLETEEITGAQQQRMQQIEMRNLRQDQQLEQILEGVSRLGEVAVTMGEEVHMQGKMLEELDKDLNAVKEHVDTVNTRMAEVLKEVREADRFCMDVFCILLLLGCVGVFLKMQREQEATDALEANAAARIQ